MDCVIIVPMEDVNHYFVTAALAVAVLWLGKLIQWISRRRGGRKPSPPVVLDDVYLKIFNENIYPKLKARVRREIEKARNDDPHRVDRWYWEVLARMNRFVADKGKEPATYEFEEMWDALSEAIQATARGNQL